jgi:eukaryotic-like serine/threonine-protein kinase
VLFFSEKLGHYTILRELERGGMASIDLAIHDDSDDLCVIKRLQQGDWSKPHVVKRFHREAKVASMLDHPNVARVIDAGLEDGVFCLVSEFVPGKTLASYRAQLGRLGRLIPPDLTVWMALEVLAALDHVHKSNLIHRDISARNVMIRFDGAIKVIDFGLAKADFDDFQTVQGTLLGTFPYLAPEQAAGGTLDGRADLYSLSVILFETLTGRAMIKRTQPAEMLQKILHDPLPPYSAFPPEVPTGVRAAVIRGLAKSPDDRWTSALEYRLALAAGVGEIADGQARLASSVRDLFAEEVREIEKVIAFYQDGGEGLRTAQAMGGAVEVPVDSLISDTVPAMRLHRESNARQIAFGLAMLGLGFLMGWLLLPSLG